MTHEPTSTARARRLRERPFGLLELVDSGSGGEARRERLLRLGLGLGFPQMVVFPVPPTGTGEAFINILALPTSSSR